MSQRTPSLRIIKVNGAFRSLTRFVALPSFWKGNFFCDLHNIELSTLYSEDYFFCAFTFLLIIASKRFLEHRVIARLGCLLEEKDEEFKALIERRNSKSIFHLEQEASSGSETIVPEIRPVPRFLTRFLHAGENGKIRR